VCSKNIYLSWILHFFLICLFVQTSKAEKTLFSIDSHASPVAVRAYAIEGNVIKDPVTISEDLFGYGPVGAAVSEKLGLLFVTYEEADIVPVFRCRTLLKVADVDTDVLDQAGIVADDDKDKIYILQRDTRRLYVYTWNEITENLELDDDNPHNLAGLLSGKGIALDGEYLYVTDSTTTVRCYNTTTWAHDDSNDITLPEDNGAWGIAIYHDSLDNRYGYFGGYSSHNNLIRVNLDDTNDYIIVTPSETSGEGVAGIAVDPNSGLVYASVDDGSNRVFDTSLNELYSIDTNVTGPAGMAVGNRYYSPFRIEKSDDVDDNDCASPQMGEITYAICYDYQWDEESDPDPCEFDSLSIIDYLPQGVDFVFASDDGSYDSDTHTVTWTISLDPFDPNCVELTVQTNKNVIPGSEITNKAEISTTLTIDSQELDYSDSYEINTPICDCSEYGNIIYVDDDADSGGDGTGWDEAFDNLQDALAVTWPCDEVWVAEGIYEPTTNPNDSEASFSLLNAVGVYGGFKGLEGGETQRYERNWFDNGTILNGYIEAIGSEPNNVDYVVVSDANVVNTLDGFTIQNGSIAGIYCGRLSPLIIQHNKITTNGTGIYCDRTKQPVIKNNWLYRNDYGLYLESPTGVAIVRNNTVANNDQMGIYQEYGVEPAISNCIFSGNPEDSDLVGCYATYSYIEYPIVLDPNGTWPIGEGNIDGDPNYPPFVEGVDDYHLDPCSACIDAGDPNGSYGGERDIDKHFRVLNGNGENYNKRVDMGADEYCNQGSDNDADFNEDSIVNYIDFAIFGKAWLSEQGDGNWNPDCDISEITDDVIDANDLIVFAQEWLWMTCEEMEGIPMEMMMGMGGGMGRMMGMESVLISATATAKAATQQQISEAQPQDEPSVEEQIAQAKRSLNFWLREDVREGMEDKELWLRIVTDLEERLKELEDSQ